ncbi:hypothetical protein NQ317_011271 [Molorchus minor]|uniref:Tyr recombinase domain-containing protein n=1 Tax=Molorchus minor TaxID=1323400 RepID=A0ABQ9JU24_9CUCU|nr:hypothetical protein NQ317_011271 [Molorchus minor]
MGKIPSVVASYLKLPDVACYTGHCLRRSSATLLADAGVDITTIKRHAGWKSTTVAEGYVENSIENKTKIANQVLVGTTTSAITKTANFQSIFCVPQGRYDYLRYQMEILMEAITAITGKSGTIHQSVIFYQHHCH